MVNAVPGRNLPVLSFAYHLPKPWSDACIDHIWRTWYNGSYYVIAKPIKTLELHYLMIKFLIILHILLTLLYLKVRGLELGIDKSRPVDISSSVAQKTKLIHNFHKLTLSSPVSLPVKKRDIEKSLT